jgi:hypothetical protein
MSRVIVLYIIPFHKTTMLCDAKSRIKFSGAKVSGMIVSPGGTPKG